jgi:hypothetical protein
LKGEKVLLEAGVYVAEDTERRPSLLRYALIIILGSPNLLLLPAHNRTTAKSASKAERKEKMKRKRRGKLAVGGYSVDGRGQDDDMVR